jgi:hypothetical protein
MLGNCRLASDFWISDAAISMTWKGTRGPFMPVAATGHGTCTSPTTPRRRDSPGDMDKLRKSKRQSLATPPRRVETFDTERDA